MRRLSSPWAFIVVGFLLAALACASPAAAVKKAPPKKFTPTGATKRLQSLIENVTAAPIAAYDLKDDRGNGMVALKIVACGCAQRYLGIYHNQVGNGFVLRVAYSNDLLHWHYVRDLAASGSQGTIRPLGKGFVIAHENSTPYIHIEVSYYSSVNALLAGRASRNFHAPLTLSSTAEGTPSIDAIVTPKNKKPSPENSVITIGFHYFRFNDIDREAQASLTRFRRWVSRPLFSLDALLMNFGLRGNLGDRDMFVFAGRQYGIFEGQTQENDWAAWRLYLYDKNAGAFVALNMRPLYGQVSFGNPTAAILPAPSGGGKVLVITSFLFNQGAPRGPGEMMYYRAITDKDAASLKEQPKTPKR